MGEGVSLLSQLTLKWTGIRLPPYFARPFFSLMGNLQMKWKSIWRATHHAKTKATRSTRSHRHRGPIKFVTVKTRREISANKRKWSNLQSSRPWRLAIDSPNVLARMKGAPPGADRSPAVRGGPRRSDWMMVSSSLLRVTWGTQHVTNHDGPGHPPSLIPPFIQHITVNVQLSHCPSISSANNC